MAITGQSNEYDFDSIWKMQIDLRQKLPTTFEDLFKNNPEDSFEYHFETLLTANLKKYRDPASFDFLKKLYEASQITDKEKQKKALNKIYKKFIGLSIDDCEINLSSAAREILEENFKENLTINSFHLAGLEVANLIKKNQSAIDSCLSIRPLYYLCNINNQWENLKEQYKNRIQSESFDLYESVLKNLFSEIKALSPRSIVPAVFSSFTPTSKSKSIMTHMKCFISDNIEENSSTFRKKAKEFFETNFSDDDIKKIEKFFNAYENFKKITPPNPENHLDFALYNSIKIFSENLYELFTLTGIKDLLSAEEKIDEEKRLNR